MTKRVFIWVAHPRSDTFNHAIADAYEAGVRRQGAEIIRMNLSDMQFAAEFDGYENAHALEPDLVAWQEAVAWADHILIVHPYWWGAMPTKAKAVLDRALTPGFAYKYHSKGVAWDKLLAGKTGDAIITSDTPPLIDTFIYRKPARRVIKNQVLGFCGIKARSVRQFGSVKMAGPRKRKQWLGQAQAMGLKAAA